MYYIIRIANPNELEGYRRGLARSNEFSQEQRIIFREIIGFLSVRN